MVMVEARVLPLLAAILGSTLSNVMETLATISFNFLLSQVAEGEVG